MGKTSVQDDQAGRVAAEDHAANGWQAIHPFFERAPIIAFLVTLSSGFPFAMIAATLTTRLAADGIDKKSITAFSLTLLIYNCKSLWAWVIEGVRLPVIGRLGQRVSWMLVLGCLVIVANLNLAAIDPKADLMAVVYAAIFMAFAGASFDIVIDAYRIEWLEPHQLGAGSGMAQYGWRVGNYLAGASALYLAYYFGWHWAYAACSILALSAMGTALVAGEPPRHKPIAGRPGVDMVIKAIWQPLVEFFSRHGAVVVMLFILVHKVGDTLANLTFRLLFDHLGYTTLEIANYDVGLGWVAYLVGIFLGGVGFARLGMKWSVLVSLVLMAVSNLSFAALAASGHSNIGMAAAIGFENIASGFGGVAVTAYFAALCNLRFTATQYALISAASSIVGRLLTGASAGALIDAMGYVNFYLFTTVLALPGIAIFLYMIRTGLVDEVVGGVGREETDGQPS